MPSPSPVAKPSVWLLGAALLLAAGPMAPGEAGGETGAHLIWVVGWLLLPIAVFGAAILRKRPVEIRFTTADIWLTVGCLLMGAAAVWGSRNANARAGWNMAWYWTGIACCLIVVRQALASAAARHVMLFLMWSAAVALSIHGMAQFAVTMPAMVEQYESSSEAEKVKQLTAMGVDPDPEGAPRIQFENRLKSTEPYATFALANSLAGVLAPWLVVAVGLLLLPQPKTSYIVAGLISVMAVGGCLVLTKSRTAVVAVAAGGAALAVADLRGPRRFGWRLPVAGAVAAVLAVVGGVAVGALDKEVVTEAFMSLAYRMEYWKATTEIIADHWMIGVGSGNFQDYYAQHQLPHASELVADPHNFALEIAATGGVPALLIFLAGWAQTVRATWRENSPAELPDSNSTAAKQSSRKSGKSHSEAPRSAEMGAAWLATGVGVTLGWLAALGMGFASEFLLGMPLPLLSAAVAIAITWWMWRHSALRQEHSQHEQGGWLRVVILVALATALLNLMAAGGISHWGVMQTVVMLGVLAPASNPSLKSLTLSSNAAAYVLIALVVALLALQFTALRPVIGAQQAMSLAHEASSADEAILHLRAAADADPWSAEPFQMLGQLRAAQGRLDSDTWDLFEQALERDQRNPNLWAEMGRWKLVGSKFGADQPLWAEAVQHYRRALALTPRGPWQARLAWVLQFGDAEAQREARQLATAALDWNESHPHIEQRLDRLVLPSPNGTVSAEQAMLNLRNSGN